MMMKPRTKPRSGERSIGTMTFHSRPAPLYQCSWLGCDQMMTCQLLWEAARAAPQSAPISAWLELDGRPNHQVSRFQAIAPSNVQMMMSDVMATILASTRPLVMVLATAVPHMAPKRLVNAASMTA